MRKTKTLPVHPSAFLLQPSRTMSTFYVLPPRPALEDRLADCLGPLLPGLGWAPPRPGGGRLADLLLEALAPASDVYLVCRDELPPGAAAEQALVDGFGAGAG